MKPREQLVFDAIKNNPYSDRAGLESASGMNRNTISTYLSRLKNAGLITVSAKNGVNRYQANISRDMVMAVTRKTWDRGLFLID